MSPPPSRSAADSEAAGEGSRRAGPARRAGPRRARHLGRPPSSPRIAAVSVRLLLPSVPASRSLLTAIELVREFHAGTRCKVPLDTPISFVRRSWRSDLIHEGTIDRRAFELCVLIGLRDRLRAGDVWIGRSRASARSRTNSCSVPSSAPCARPDRCCSRCRTILERGSPTVGLAWPDAWWRSRPRLSATRLRTCAWTAGVRASRRRGSSRPRRPSTGRAPLLVASRRPHYRAVARGRSPDRLLRCLHPSEQRPHDPGSPGAADRHPRGRDQSRRNAHGRRLCPRHPPSARVDRRMAPARGQLRPGARHPRQRAAPHAALTPVRRRHLVELGRTELPARPARRGDRGREPAQGIRTRRRVLHPRLRHLRALPLQGSSPHPQARRHTYSTVSCITPPT